MSLAHGDLVDPDGRRLLDGMILKLALHILDVYGLDRIPVQSEYLGNRGCAGLPGTGVLPADKALDLLYRLRQPGKRFRLHLATPGAIHATNLDLKPDPPGTAVDIADQPKMPIVVAGAASTAMAAEDHFSRRTKGMIRPWGSLG